MLNSKMKMSIITPNYNYDKYIGETIQSVLFQNVENIEHIIIDDGSTDNSAAVLKKYQAKYPDKIKLIFQENKGQTAAINKGLKLSYGDIIGWINSDDTYCQGIFKKIISIFENNLNIDIVIGNANVVDLDGHFIYKIRHNKYDFVTGALLGFTRITTSNAVFWRKRIMDKVGYMDESLKCSMDGEYFSRLFRKARVFQINDSVANFRKQIISIVAIKEKNWNNSMYQNELNFVKMNSINYVIKEMNLSGNRINFMMHYLKLKRILQKIYKLYYLKMNYEKMKYRLKIIN
jgi:glycosyltransferase involved in cell wall biosynthesis